MARVEVILTFDDGPDTRSGSANGTERILHALENNPTGHALNAVFFIQSHAKNDQDNYFRGMHSEGKRLVKKMTDAGHIVGVHTGMDGQNAHAEENDHPHRYNAEELMNDLNRAKDFILRFAKQTARYVRPPYGNMDDEGNVQRTYDEAALYRIMWDVDSKDSRANSDKESIKTALTERIEELMDRGDTKLVILFHDTHPVTNKAGNLGEFITTITDAIEDKGHTPVWDLSTDRIRTILDEYGENAR
ncbi:MAG: polysaccharide deacetylase family protein [Candidatus Poribacteria bacterium]|nr:polysaccharide deacetylase family protein [Candidatus Poribacteria bacterium]